MIRSRTATGLAAGSHAAAGIGVRRLRAHSRYRGKEPVQVARLMPHWAAAAVTDSCAETTFEDGDLVLRHAADVTLSRLTVTDQVSPCPEL